MIEVVQEEAGSSPFFTLSSVKCWEILELPSAPHGWSWQLLEEKN